MPAVTRLAGLLLIAAAAGSSAHAAEPYGTWLTGDGQARIRVERCGRNLCGTVVWLKQPTDPATGRPQVDDKNPNPAKQRRPIIGLRIFAMKPAGGKWAGLIYNADDGKNYDASITVPSPSTLVVRGCAGVFCGDDRWTRVESGRRR